jgi:hypothetical protein
MNFDFFGRETATESSADIAHVVIAGWAGRDKTALENHIAELERAGIPRPETTPAFYRVGNNLLTQALEIQVSSTSSSGDPNQLPAACGHLQMWRDTGMISSFALIVSTTENEVFIRKAAWR